MYFKYSMEELESLKSKDDKLKKAIEKIGMIKRKTYPDLFYGLIKTIAGQQISTKAAATVWNNILEKVKRVTPENLNKTSIDEIQACGTSFRKAEYILLAAKAFALKELDINKLKELEDEAFIKELIKLKGVGVWTAEMLLIFSLNRMNVLSYNDLGIRRGIKRLYNLEDLDKEKFNQYKEKYSPYNSIASLYLWEISSGGI